MSHSQQRRWRRWAIVGATVGVTAADKGLIMVGARKTEGGADHSGSHSNIEDKDLAVVA